MIRSLGLGNVGADHDVAEVDGDVITKVVAIGLQRFVERKRQNIGRTLVAQVGLVELADDIDVDEQQINRARGDVFGHQGLGGDCNPVRQVEITTRAVVGGLDRRLPCAHRLFSWRA